MVARQRVKGFLNLDAIQRLTWRSYYVLSQLPSAATPRKVDPVFHFL